MTGSKKSTVSYLKGFVVVVPGEDAQAVADIRVNRNLLDERIFLTAPFGIEFLFVARFHITVVGVRCGDYLENMFFVFSSEDGEAQRNNRLAVFIGDA